MRKATLTVGVITKNEEKNIEACIRAVKGWADEIIVIDGCSADRTREIAENLGAKVITHEFEGSFATERNLVMENASSDWVLHIDADDRVTKDFRSAVDNVLGTEPGADVYKFRRKNFFLGRFMNSGGWYHYVPNLVKRGSVSFEGALHERPVHSGNISQIDADIEHHPFQTISQLVLRHNRYSSLEAQKMFEDFGASRLNEIRKNAIRRTFKLFWKMYVKKKGYKEGMHGLVFSILFAFTNFLTWIKYWEFCVQNNRA